MLVLRPLIALVAFCFASLSLIFAADTKSRPPEKRVYKEIDGTKLEIWIWKPAGWKPSDRRSGIVYFHGGGWRSGSPSSFARLSSRMADHGMVAFSVQYRLTTQPGITVVDCVKDARSAFRWVRAHAQELGLDPEKIAAGGSSAGGHLAAALATTDAVNDARDDLKISTQPAALVLFAPPVKLSGLRAEPDKRFNSLRDVAAVDPFEHVKRGHPPTLIFHGEADPVVPIASARAYAAKVESLGGKCRVVGFPDQGHSFAGREPFFSDTLKQTESFLQSAGLLKPAAAPASSK